VHARMKIYKVSVTLFVGAHTEQEASDRVLDCALREEVLVSLEKKDMVAYIDDVALLVANKK
jgi:hypothetical protein